MYRIVSTKKMHLRDCLILELYPKQERFVVNSISKRKSEGYTFCEYCYPIYRQLKECRQKLNDFCKENDISYHIHNEELIILTPYSKWKVVVTESGELQLLHRESFDTNDEYTSLYHIQNVMRNHVFGFFTYIVNHDRYRNKNPVKVLKGKKKPVKPYTKKWNNKMRTKKRSQKKKSARNVCRMIDNLSKYNGVN